MDIIQLIKNRLQNFHPQIIEVRDDSNLHIGHIGNQGGGHYNLLIVSDVFEHTGRIQRHRMIKEALNDLFLNGLIHALSIKAVSSKEYYDN